MYTAELKRPISQPKAEKQAAVEELLGVLALAPCRGVRIGSPMARGISGGEGARLKQSQSRVLLRAFGISSWRQSDVPCLAAWVDLHMPAAAAAAAAADPTSAPRPPAVRAGQAKRVNIGIALISNPSVLFLDEPVSDFYLFWKHACSAARAPVAPLKRARTRRSRCPMLRPHRSFARLPYLLLPHGIPPHSLASSNCLFAPRPLQTSGLDSYTANEVMSVVKSLTNHGITVCATIHSPTPYCFNLFDRVLLLLRGQVAFFGPNGAPGPAAAPCTRLWLECLPLINAHLPPIKI